MLFGNDPVEAEALKLILNGGSFALLAVLTVWTLYRGAPMLEKMAVTMAAEHRRSFERCEAAHEAVVKGLAEECRQERLAMFQAFAAERDKDRDARHKAAGLLQEAIGEFRAEFAERRKHDDKNYRGPESRGA